MNFPTDFLDELRARLSLAQVIARRVRLVRKGREHLGLCPFHKEKTPSFTVNEDKGFYHCFGCGAHGSVFDFVMQTEGLSFPEAVERLAAEAGLPLPARDPHEAEKASRRKNALGAAEAAAQWYAEQLREPEGRQALSYLRERGLSGETIAAFRLGYAPGARGALERALGGKGFETEQLIEAGLVKKGEGGELRAYFFDRIIFPITDRQGRVIAFGGRSLGESQPKYLNSPEGPLFRKGQVLYNQARARKAALAGGELLVCEGYMDVIALDQAGLMAAVAPLGTAVTEEQLVELWRLAAEPLVCLDGDAAGRRAGYRLAERALPRLRPGFSLRFVLLPDGEDPDSLLRGQGPEALKRLLELALPLHELVWLKETEGRSFDTPERRAGLRARLLEIVGQIAQPDVQRAYRDMLLARFEESFRRTSTSGGFLARESRRRSFEPRPDWSRSSAVGGAGTRRAPAQLLRRRDQVLVATLLHHPELIADHAEDLAVLDFGDRELAGVLGEILDWGAQSVDLDSLALKRHLCNQGFSAVLDALAGPTIYELGPFARADAPLDAARRGLEEGIAHARARQARQEADEAMQRFLREPSEENLALVEAKRKLMTEGEAHAEAYGQFGGGARRKPD